jgi:hypothetical protein
MSMNMFCTKNEGVASIGAAVFSTRNCSGEPISTQSIPGGECQQGMLITCIPHDSVPKFAQRDGLFT